eukprot:TRINITY_DN22955_c0_g1_i1.p1 TRINITY_DN22955_c0_g1~~TRINITY_DN22955_c0_g1_i1.p1  ORF type:complete len:332 (+),score=119.35 TRINITY_DN22955_c0_g1_i1:3-998(+)
MSRQATKYLFDCEKGEWVSQPCSVSVGKPFGKGAMRVAHEAVEDGEIPSVVKFSAIHKSAQGQKQSCLRDSKAQSVAEYYAGLFNKVSSEKVSFVTSYAVQFADGRWGNLEPRLGGAYKKHNNNAGGVVTRDNVAQAFSHFTYRESHESLVVCDIQGVGTMYTDPQILSVQEATGEQFGDGDLGRKGIAAFLATHKCNALCRAAGLPENTKYRAGGSDARRRSGGGDGFEHFDDILRQFRHMGFGDNFANPFPRAALQSPRGEGRAAAAAGLREALRQSEDETAQAERARVQRALAASRQLKEDEDLARALAASGATKEPPGRAAPSRRYY